MNDAKHFLCTTCGKCCYGQLPLTIKDALNFAHLFPLAMVWTPVQKGSKDFNWVSKLGAPISILKDKELASLIVPTAFIPKNFPCPALVEGKYCSIQLQKPSRCKSMPFYPYRDERFQAELLKPRQGWDCDISPNAPLVYENQKIVQREDFEQEKSDLLEQVPQIRTYAQYMLKYSDSLANRLWLASTQSKGAYVVTSLSSFLTALRHPNASQIAAKQLPVLERYAVQTAEDPKLSDFHSYYVGWAKEMFHLKQGE